MYQYSFFKDIDDDSPLAKQLSRAMKEMNAMRMAAAPQSFKTQNQKEGPFLIHKFYSFCLYENWAHEAIRTLRSWESLLGEYFDTFAGSWKLYAIDKRTECIKKYGSDFESDYNEDGSVRTEGLTDDELNIYSLIEDLNSSSGRILCENTEEHIKHFANDVLIATQHHFSEFLNSEAKNRGVPITPHTIGEDGCMRPMTFAEQNLWKASRAADGDEIAFNIIALDRILHMIDNFFTGMPFNDDNTECLKDTQAIIKKTLNADFEPFENK